MRDFHKYGIDTRGRSSGKIKTTCPQCNETRGHKGDKSLSVDLGLGLAHCFHCQYSIYVPDDAEERAKQAHIEKYRKTSRLPSHFRRPVFDPQKSQLSENMERYWTKIRCLPQELLKELRITEQVQFMQQSGTKENCICFNYFEGDTLINTKFRSAQKHFMLVPGAELIPYNIDGILGSREAIITEGEFDACALMAATGRRDIISVPAGAQSNLSWMDRFVETHFDDKETIYLAVDNDQAGQVLQQELIRRLGAERCRLMEYGEGCKDSNEHLVRYGAESLRIYLEQSEEIPLEGVFNADNYREELRSIFENGLKRGAETGWENFDENCTFETGRLMVVTGRPGEGKSEFTDELALRLCLNHAWKAAYYSPENMPVEYHLKKLADKLLGKEFAANTYSMTEREYIRSLLNKLGRFATQHKCLVVLIAHPRKVNRNELSGTQRRVEMNDINGSADFGNMSDYCIDVDRDDNKGIVTIYIDKVRFKHLGKGNTSAKFVYDFVSGRYFPCKEDIIRTSEGDKPGPIDTQFDRAIWLKEKEEQACLFD